MVVAGLFLLIRATDPTRSRILMVAAASLAAAPVTWLFAARLTQRLLPPVSAYLLMLGLLLGATGFALDARFPMWLRVTMVLLLVAVLTLVLRFWVAGPAPDFLV
ncbi:MAG: hypothetical protein ACOX9R_06960 [Armatimonadota bacterium]